MALGLMALLIEFFVLLLPTWSIWPAEFLTGLTYFFSIFAKLNFILPIDTLMIVVNLFCSFLGAYFTVKIILRIVNYVRGTGAGLDI